MKFRKKQGDVYLMTSVKWQSLKDGVILARLKSKPKNHYEKNCSVTFYIVVCLSCRCC